MAKDTKAAFEKSATHRYTGKGRTNPGGDLVMAIDKPDQRERVLNEQFLLHVMDAEGHEFFLPKGTFEELKPAA